MKWTEISYQDYESLSLTLKNFIFLETLGIKSATKPADKAQGEFDDFCADCKLYYGTCECNNYDSNQDDGDRAYDAWKDAQLGKR